MKTWKTYSTLSVCLCAASSTRIFVLNTAWVQFTSPSTLVPVSNHPRVRPHVHMRSSDAEPSARPVRESYDPDSSAPLPGLKRIVPWGWSTVTEQGQLKRSPAGRAACRCGRGRCQSTNTEHTRICGERRFPGRGRGGEGDGATSASTQNKDFTWSHYMHFGREKWRWCNAKNPDLADYSGGHICWLRWS